MSLEKTFLLPGTYKLETNVVSYLDEVLLPGVDVDFLKKLFPLGSRGFVAYVPCTFYADDLVGLAFRIYGIRSMIFRIFGMEQKLLSWPDISISYMGKDFLKAFHGEESSDEDLQELVESFRSLKVDSLDDEGVKEAFRPFNPLLDVSVDLYSIWQFRNVMEKGFTDKGVSPLESLDRELRNTHLAVVYSIGSVHFCVPNLFEDPIVMLTGECKTWALAGLKMWHDAALEVAES